MKELEIKLTNHIKFLLGTCLCLCIFTVILLKENKNQENRLNEHKRLLIAQQEQINKLILNAKKHELNK